MALESVGESVISKITELLVEPAIKQFRYMFCFNNFLQEFNEQKQNLTLALDQDYDIPIEDLTRYGVGCGLHRDAESIEDARKQLCVAVKNLKDCCMLLGTEIEERVKMHDLVRDVAIQIASSSNEFDFVLKTGTGLKEWPGSFESFEDCTTISLMGNRLTELREGLVCPQLKVLLLELKDSLDVPCKFFEGMKALEVLSLNGGCLSLESLECSTNLQSLQFIECECKDLISLGKLLRLKILGFLGCSSIEELPEEIGELENLRLLDLRSCRRLERIPVNLIGRWKKLEELLIGDKSFTEWGVGGTSRGGMNASLTELNSLSHLSVLSLSIPEIKYIPRDFVFPKLLKYEILLGVKSYPRFPWHLEMLERSYPTSRRLAFGCISATSLNAKTFEHLLPGVSQLNLSFVEGLKNIIWSPDQMTTHEQQQGFLRQLECVLVSNCGDMCTLFPAKSWRALKNLRSASIRHCDKLEEVFVLGEVDQVSDEEKVLLLSSLTELVLEELPTLQCIWKGPTRHVSLQSLTRLNLWSLFKLKFIFTPSLAQCLPQLETLQIEDCCKLEHIIASKDDNYEGEIIPDSICFPKLKTLSISCCWELEYVFPVSVARRLLNLEEIHIEDADKLKQIFGSGEGEDVPTTDGDGIILFPQLRKLELSRSGSNLNFFGSNNFAAELPSLQDLQIEGHKQLGNLLAKLLGLANLRNLSIEDCEGVEEVMQVGSFVTNRRGGHELSLLSLETLKLSSLPDLRSICKGLVLKNLTTLEVIDCKGLRHLFPSSMIDSLLQLKVLKISGCEEMEEIIAMDDGEMDQILLGTEHLRSLCFPNLLELSLQRLPSLVCFSTATYDFIFPRLEKLKVKKCPKMTAMLAVAANHSTSAKPEALLFEFIGLTNLRNLSIGDCEGVEEVMQVGSFVTNRRGGSELSLLSLETLKLSSLPDLRSICKGLVLKNLTTLEVVNCNGLRHLFPCSMIGSLLQLKVIKISVCEELEEIIAMDNDGEMDQILLGTEHLKSLCFPNLLELSLNGSPSLVCFSTATYDFIFPRLEELEVEKCPKMTAMLAVAANHSTSAKPEGLTNLRNLRIEDCEGVEEVMQVGGFVTNRRGGSELSLLSLETLKLSSLPDLRSICKGLMLKNLTTLEVVNCNGLRHILPSSMIASLLQLKVLTISRCEELEEIIAKDDDDKDQILSETRLQSLCFPSLRDIEVSQCNKLKSLFPVIIAAGLPQLTNLEVREAPQLTEVFGQDDKASRLNVNVVPILRGLSLKNLPSIVCFSLGCKNFLFPCLEACVVGNCPKMATQFTVAPDGSMSAQSEVSQVAEASSSSCAMPSSTYKMWTRDGGWEEQDSDFES
ncbi:unnamed protein product [Dovyalis caffra]|uniref:Disease resistance protein At4g27190-like leucine-rich repeats domain-containing protein n=1 Tax=Dovyalis caffra TaxID=77055 RepID=A0AAV1RP46_9ROSI|nr:unnamed protein product [Dovyalis caffra]